MKKKIIIGIVLLGIVVLAGAVSCSDEELQADYDILTTQYAEAIQQIEELQEDLLEAGNLQADLDVLQAQYDALTDQNDANIAEIASLAAQIEDLENELDELTEEIETKTNELAELAFDYDELQDEYDALVGAELEINEENIEEALFALINQERAAHGLNELAIGTNLVNWSVVNSQNMVVSKQVEVFTTHAVPFQMALITTGYSSLDRLVNSTLAIWQNHALTYEANVLDEEAAYGAVGVVKSGEIYYITFMASNYP